MQRRQLVVGVTVKREETTPATCCPPMTVHSTVCECSMRSLLTWNSFASMHHDIRRYLGRKRSKGKALK